MIIQPFLAALVLVLALGGCSSTSERGTGASKDGGPATAAGGLDRIPDAVPRAEPLHRSANRVYAVQGRTYRPQAAPGGYRKEGLASWYGQRFHGRKTASGERYDMYAMTAAHRTLPIPSYARVTSLSTGKSVVVRINDRGPFHGKRIIDLSYAAAHKLGYISQGSARVRVESIDPDTYAAEREANAPAVYLQLGAFAKADNAEQLVRRLARELAIDADRARVVRDGALHRVQVGPYRNDEAAHADRERVRERLDVSGVLVRRD